mgnify:FL=1
MGLSAGCSLLRFEQLAGVGFERGVHGLGQEDAANLGQISGSFAGAERGLALRNGFGNHWLRIASAISRAIFSEICFFVIEIQSDTSMRNSIVSAITAQRSIAFLSASSASVK